MTPPKHTNRLINESSPYLLQHAHNPVDWYPWGEEALTKARKEDKPIIVSIGYSSCHWCHVMERESFENEQAADLMNKYFVCIKVDREERPDVDQIYMDAIQTMGIRGGWPLNVFLTADQKPFYGGTYFPLKSWTQLLQNIAEAYTNQREALVESAEQFARAINVSEVQKYGLQNQGGTFEKEDHFSMFQKLASDFDPEEGGMKGAPKFPMPAIWRYILHNLSINANDQAREQLATTLGKMAAGGIYDQVGGGFSRYSVDKNWFAPHFEKMLYDNGQLVSLYAEAYRYFKDEHYKAIVYQTIDYIEREMLSHEGGFYAALDADSEGEEGRFYTWTLEEFQNIVGEDSLIWIPFFGLTVAGNWENGRNILHRTQSLASLAEESGFTETVLKEKLEKASRLLLEARNARIRPGLDDKILTGWNGMMLKGIIDAYVSFGETKFLQLALKNALFIKNNLFIDQSTLCRSYKEGKAIQHGYLEDYAHIIRAYTALYQVTFDEVWLKLAEQLTLHVLEHFYDEAETLFYFTDDQEKLIARKKEVFDNVIPASNSVMAENLYDLSILLDNDAWRKISESMVMKVKKLIINEPRHMSHWATIYLKMTYPTAEVAIVGANAAKAVEEFGDYAIFNLLFSGTEDKSSLPLLAYRTATNGQRTIYVCYGKACQLPVHTVSDALQHIQF